MGAIAGGKSIPPPAITEREARDRSHKKHDFFFFYQNAQIFFEE